MARLFLWSTPILPRDHVSTNIGFSLRYMPWISLRQIWFRLRWFSLQIYGQFGVTSDFTTALFLCSYPLPFSSTILSVLGAPVSIVNDTDFTPVARLCVFLFRQPSPASDLSQCHNLLWTSLEDAFDATCPLKNNVVFVLDVFSFSFVFVVSVICSWRSCMCVLCARGS